MLIGQRQPSLASGVSERTGLVVTVGDELVEHRQCGIEPEMEQEMTVEVKALALSAADQLVDADQPPCRLERFRWRRLLNQLDKTR